MAVIRWPENLYVRTPLPSIMTNAPRSPLCPPPLTGYPFSFPPPRPPPLSSDGFASAIGMTEQGIRCGRLAGGGGKAYYANDCLDRLADKQSKQVVGTIIELTATSEN